MSDTSNAIRNIVACPRCGARPGHTCSTATGRNHPERAKAAVREAIAQEADARGAPEIALGLRDRSGR